MIETKYKDMTTFESLEDWNNYLKSLGPNEGYKAHDYQIVYRKQKALKALEDNGTYSEVFFRHLGNHESLEFFIENYELIKKSSFYEQALFDSYVGVNMNMVAKVITVDKIVFCLDLADKAKLRAVGDELQQNGAIQVYRGVKDYRNKRSIRRISWTLDKNIAIAFAKNIGRPNRYPSDKPAVFSLTVPQNAIYFYTNIREEEEVVLDPKKCGPSKLVQILT